VSRGHSELSPVYRQRKSRLVVVVWHWMVCPVGMQRSIIGKSG
jgi:hypothetical protein